MNIIQHINMIIYRDVSTIRIESGEIRLDSNPDYLKISNCRNLNADLALATLKSHINKRDWTYNGQKLIKSA